MAEGPLESSPTIFTSALPLAATAALLYMALLFREPALYLLTALLLLVAGGARLWGELSRWRVTAAFHVADRRVFPGQAIALVADVRQAKRLPVGVRLDWPEAGPFQPRGPSAPGRQTGLLGRCGLAFRSELVALRRGMYPVSPPRIRTSDPLGLYPREIDCGPSVPVIVYPRLVALKAAVFPRHELLGAAGHRSPVTDPAYVLGTRDYLQSGPSRHIHWKASARRLRLQEKVFEPSGQASVLLALEVGGYEVEQAEEDFERTLEVIASLGVQLGRRGFAVGLASNGGVPVVPLGRGRLPALLEALARMPRRACAPLEQVLAGASCLRRGSSCVAFLYEADGRADGLGGLCCRLGVPAVGFACHPPREPQGPHRPSQFPFRLLSELADPERGA